MKLNQWWASLRQKTVWDWLQLLIVPVILSVGGFLLNLEANVRQERLADKRRLEEKALADQRRQEDVFRDYLNQMSGLLLNELQKDKKNKNAMILAQARTATALRELDVQHRNLLLDFLRSANLATSEGVLREAFLVGIELNHTSLNGFNLQSANLENSKLRYAELSLYRENNRGMLWSTNLGGALLSGADLTGAQAIGTNFSDAEFRDANLHEAALIDVDLTKTDLTEAQLSVAKLCNTKLPDGSVSVRDCAELKKRYPWLKPTQ